MRQNGLMRVTAATLCFCLVLNLLGPAFHPISANPEVSSPAPATGQPTAMLQYATRKSVNLTDALDLLLKDVEVYQTQQKRAGSQLIRPDQIGKRYAEIRAHYDRVCRQLERDQARTKPAGKKAQVQRTRVYLDGQMAWLKARIDTVVAAKTSAASRQAALGELAGKVRTLRTGPNIPKTPLSHGALAQKSANNTRSTGTRTAASATPAAFPDTQEMVDLVNRLDRDPLKIYQYLRNQCDYEPYQGFVKGPGQTLLEKAGNDADLAALFAGLLRIAGYNARYANGQVRLTMQQAMNWVGTRDPKLAAAFFTRNGIAARVLTSGETYTGVILDHWWVQAYLPYHPAQGTRRGEPDTWLNLDPSFKTYRFRFGHDVATEVGINAYQFLAGLKTQATIGEDGAFVTGLPEQSVYDQLQGWTEKVRAYAQTNDLTADGIYLGREIVAEDLGVLPAGLPYKQEGSPTVLTEIPASAITRLTIKGLDAKGLPALSYGSTLPGLIGKRLTISYRPATTDDAQVIADFGGDPGFPAYLVKLVPEIKLGGKVVAAGSAVGMGEQQVFTFTYETPDGTTETSAKALTAGCYAAVALDLGRMPAETIHQRTGDLRLHLQQLQNGQTVQNDDALGEMLSLWGLNYFLEADRLNAITGSALDVAVVRQPSHMVMAYDFKTDDLFGLPYRVQNTKLASWLGRDSLVPVSKTGQAEKERQFLITSALTASALQHGVFSQTAVGADAVSILKVLQKANAGQTPIITLTKANCTKLIDYLPDLSAGQRTEITNYIQAGYQVTIPQNGVSIGTWGGNGYLVFDPFTSASAFRFTDSDWSGVCPSSLLTAGDLFGVSTRHTPLMKALTVWAGQLEQAMEAFAWSYIPAASVIDSWFANNAAIDPTSFVASAILLSGPIQDFVTRPTIIRPVVSSSAFSPNGDGKLDTVTVTAELTRPSDWKVTVLDTVGTELRVFSGSGQTVQAVWDGRDGFGDVAPEAGYRLQITAIDKEYATEARSVVRDVALDVTAPTLALVRPADGGTVQGYLNVIGTADDPHFASYKVSLGAGAAPTAWETLGTGQTPVVQGSLALLDTLPLDNGLYSLAITGDDAAGNQATLRAQITVSNADTAPRVQVTGPAAGAAVSGVMTYAAEATDDQPGVTVTFFLDGKALPAVAQAPYQGTYPTYTLKNGPHQIYAVARDSAGHTTTSATVSFTVDNPLSELAAAPNPFSPNNDGWQDSTLITARLAASESWEIRITDAAGSAVREFSGTGESLSQAWDGKNTAGTVVADGDYTATVRLPARDFNATLTLTTCNKLTPPQVDLTTPADLAQVSGRVDLKGYVRSASLRRWWVDYRPVEGTIWTTCIEGTGPVEGYLGVWDTTLLENGPYEVRIVAEDVLGQRNAIASEFTVTGELKIGNYRLDLLDMQFSAGQLPAYLARSYDTLRKNTQTEFGYGWQAALWDAKVSMGSNYDVTITLPDGRRTTFAFTPRFPGGVYNTRIGYPEYTSLSGYPDKLTLVGINTVIRADDGSYVFMGAEMDEETGAVSPRYYKLETVDGLIYEIDKQTGVTRISDRSGNSLTRDGAGIHHNSGRSIAFERDGQGRIIKATGPDGSLVRYEYDTNGDLYKFTDATGQAYTYTYVNHALTGITGPDGKAIAVQDYDQSGRLSELRDATGKSIRIVHDLGTRTETVVDRNGNATSYRYDDRGNVIEKVDALGNRWAYAFDQKGNMLVEIDPLGNVVRKTYDSNNNVLTETDAAGNITKYTYNGYLPTSITDPLGRKTAFAFAGTNLTAFTDPLGNATALAYDTNGRFTEMADPLGNKFCYAYSPLRPDPDKVTDPLGNATDYTYDASGRVKTETRYLNQADGTLLPQVTSYEYNAAGKVTKVTRPDGTIEETEYTIHGQVQATVSDGRRTEYFYDENGRNWKITYPDGTWEQFEYDANGNKTSARGRDGQTTGYRYDATDRLVKTIYPDGSTTETRYDAAGRVIAEVAPNGAITNYEYDSLGRRTKVIDALRNETKFEYDAVGNQVAVTDALGNKTSYEYDATNRLVRTVFPEGSCVSYSYDKAGRRTSQTDQLLLTTQFGYDAGGRLTSVTDALNQITQYKYNEQGRMTDQIDANGHTTQFVYDIMGRLTEKTLPLGQKETYEYYPDGSLMAKIDANGTRTEYTYSSITKLLQTKSFSDGTRVDYTYWPDGSLKTATNNAGTTTFSYDIMGRLDRVVDPNNNVISYTYDRFGNRTQITGPHGTLKYTYDQLGRIETVTDQQGSVTRYTYDELGRQKKTSYANGTETLYTYDSLSRLTSVTNRKTSGEIITSHKYTLDAAGHRIKIEEAGSTVEYGYDKLNRLTSEKRNGVVTLDDGYTYDPVGNRLTKSSLGGNAGYTYDENDRLKSDGKYTYGWDENGNLTSRAGADGSTTYKYDPENRLIEVSGPNGTVQFAYDAQGNRISRTTSSGTITFVVDPNMPYAQVLEESGPSGAKVYAYGNDMLNVQGPEGTRWFAYDGLGSTRALTDGSGTLTDTYTYEAFGTVVHRTGTAANDFQFTGEQYEAALDMYFLRARYYEPGTGRFGARDSFGGRRLEPETLQPYAYCASDPVGCVDISGRESFDLNSLVQNIAIQTDLYVKGVGARITAAFGVGGAALGKLWQELGLYAEEQVYAVLNLIENVVIKRGYAVQSRFIDFFVKVGEKVALVEVKWSLPRIIGPALERLAGQMEAALAAGEGQVVLFSLREPALAQVRLVYDRLGDLAYRVQFVHGIEGLYKWAVMFFGLQ